MEQSQEPPASARPLEEAEPTGASRGQIIIMFALFLNGIMGVLGLATDLGFAYAQRRTMQNAADAGAIAGARALAHWSSGSSTVGSDVATLVASNKMNTTPEVAECVFVNYAESAVGSCSAAVPSTARGVRVQVREIHDTFFIRILGNGLETVTIEASATAEVQRASGAGTGGPFIVCGINTDLYGGGHLSILSSASSGAVNPSAIGQTFVVHDPKSNGNNSTVQDCGIPSASFKGLADTAANDGLDISQWWHGDTGTKAGPTREKVNGVQGCANNVASPYNCVMLLPIATNDPKPKKQGSDRQFFIMTVLAFQISQTASNQHVGKLLGSYVVSDDGSEDWCPGCGGVVVIRLSG